MQNVLFIWDGPPNNYVKVCLQSFRLYNSKCIINFYYNNEKIIDFLKEFEDNNEIKNFNLIKINEKNWNNRRLHHKLELTKEILINSPKDSELLVLDCDLLFQNDPFLMFEKFPDQDFYYTTCIMSTPDSLRPESLWKSVTYCVNGGVKGYRHTTNTINFLDFWIDNNLNLTWNKWKDYEDRHKENGVDWWYCQDFPNCIHNFEPPINLKKINVGYKFNYFTSTWGFFNENLEMGSKIGNPEYAVIHFKANFKDVYNIEDPKIYNMENILAKKKLTTKKSIDTITKKFLSRGEKRFTIV